MDVEPWEEYPSHCEHVQPALGELYRQWARSSRQVIPSSVDAGQEVLAQKYPYLHTSCQSNMNSLLCSKSRLAGQWRERVYRSYGRQKCNISSKPHEALARWACTRSASSDDLQTRSRPWPLTLKCSVVELQDLYTTNLNFLQSLILELRDGRSAVTSE